MTTEIRPARIEEIDELLELYQWLFAPPGARPPRWDPERAGEALTEAISADESLVLAAAAEGELVGLCTAYLDLHSVRYGLRCWIEDLVVHGRFRSQGTGERLIGDAGDWAREHGATHLELDTGLARTDAQRFYERLEPATVGYSYSWAL
ncbi:MAG: GNAT family N-acetyltransferase [Solirubrobacterales bacterium]